MGWFRDEREADYMGVKIVVEGSQEGYAAQVRLFIDGSRVDDVTVSISSAKLRGRLSASGRDHHVLVEVTPHLLKSATFSLMIDGAKVPLRRIA